MDGRLTIIPALRYDWYELTPTIGAIYWVDDHFGVFANYAQGFKAPSPMKVNNFSPTRRSATSPFPTRT